MPRKAKKYHYIYKTTCKLNGKFYVGMHSTNELQDGYLGSGKRLRYSIGKHGTDSHIREIIEFLPDRASLKKREKEIITENFMEDPLCMNLTTGGEGGWDHIKRTPEQQIELSKKGAEKRKYLLNNDREWSKKNSEKISDGLKRAYVAGKMRTQLRASFCNRCHSEETKKKMSDSHKGKLAGNKNPQFNKRWITKGTETKSIKIDEIQKYLDEGWKFGRTLSNKGEMNVK